MNDVQALSENKGSCVSSHECEKSCVSSHECEKYTSALCILYFICISFSVYLESYARESNLCVL